MEKFPVGTYIRQRRQDLGLTQEELCKSLNLSVSTLSRIENGRYTPSSSTIEILFEKLGLPTSVIFQPTYQNEIVVSNLRKDIQNAAVLFRRVPVEERPQLREQILEKLKELEKLNAQAEEINPRIQQFVMSTYATIGGPEGPYSAEKRLELLMEAIRLTLPKFTLNRIGKFRYNMIEMVILNKIARTYAHSGNRKKAIDIERQLLRYIEKNNQELDGFAQQFTLIAYNCAIDMALEKRYEDAVELSNKGWQVCVESGESQFQPGFVAILAECYFFLGKRERSSAYYQGAYTLYAANRDTINMGIIRQEAKEHLGLELVDYFP